MSATSQGQGAILLVEDQPDHVELIKRALDRAGLAYPVHSVSGGLEAVDYLSGKPPFGDRDLYPLPLLVLLDIRMPLMDGFEVLNWIRHAPGFETLPVVMLTGSEEIHDASRAYQLGATSFLVKEFDFANSGELSRTVQRLITQTRSNLVDKGLAGHG